MSGALGVRVRSVAGRRIPESSVNKIDAWMDLPSHPQIPTGSFSLIRSSDNIPRSLAYPYPEFVYARLKVEAELANERFLIELGAPYSIATTTVINKLKYNFEIYVDWDALDVEKVDRLLNYFGINEKFFYYVLYDKMLKKLRGFMMSEPALVDLGQRIDFCIFDITGSLAFGASYGCLDTGDYHESLKLAVYSIKASVLRAAFRYFPPLFNLLLLTAGRTAPVA